MAGGGADRPPKAYDELMMSLADKMTVRSWHDGKPVQGEDDPLAVARRGAGPGASAVKLSPSGRAMISVPTMASSA